MKTDIHNKDSTLRLISKERLEGTQKWPVQVHLSLLTVNWFGLPYHVELELFEIMSVGICELLRIITLGRDKFSLRLLKRELHFINFLKLKNCCIEINLFK